MSINPKQYADINCNNIDALFDMAIGTPLANLLTIADILKACGHPSLAHQLANHVESLADLLSQAADALSPKACL